MLGLASLCIFVDSVREEIMGQPAVAKFARGQIGVGLLLEWFEHPLVEDEAAERRLAESRKRLATDRARSRERLERPVTRDPLSA